MGKLTMKNLQILCFIGCKQSERNKRQKLSIDISVEYHSQAAENSDKIEDALNYDQLSKDITKTLTKRSFELIETVALETSRTVLRHPKALSTTVTIKKHRAIEKTDYVSFTKTYTR